MKHFAAKLRNEILNGLPGTEVQWQMASSDRMIRNFSRSPGNDAKVAAVLIILFPHNGSVYTVLMQRHDYDGNVIWGATAMIIHELLTILRRGRLSLPE
jgi:hypothetical protein